MKEEVIQSVERSIQKIVDDKTKDREDRKRKELNIVLFRAKEKRDKSGEENKKHDTEIFGELCSGLGLDSPQIVTIFRLGKRDKSIDRPMKVVMANKSQRKYLLGNAKHIPEIFTGSFSNIIISKDLTSEQRQIRKQKGFKTKEKRTDGHSNDNTSFDEDYNTEEPRTYRPKSKC